MLRLLLGCLFSFFWRSRWPLQLTMFAMVALLLFVAFFVPELLLGAFNPVTTNLAVIVLSWIGLKSNANENAA